MQKWFALIVLVAVLALVAGCAEETPAEQQQATVPTPTIAKTVKTATPATPAPVMTATPSPKLTETELTVMISDDTFNPDKVTIKVGSQVRWVNGDDHPHRVSFATGGFTAFLLAPGQSSSQKFARPGVYDYTCMMVPSMHGTVTVLA